MNKPIRNILCYSHYDFDKIMEKNGWIDSPSKGISCISICSPNESDLAEHWFKKDCKYNDGSLRVFNLDIDDISPFWFENHESKCYDDSLDLYNNGRIQLRPGMNAEQSLEASLIKILSDIRDIVGKHLRNILPRTNTALQMAICGSKGSDLNLCQMIGCVGQQTVSGNRIPNGFLNRSLPHFEPFSKYAACRMYG